MSRRISVNGIIKNRTKVIPCNTQTNRRQKGEITYIALDSCVVFDMFHLIIGRTNPKRSKQYYENLKRLLSSNVFNSDGTRNLKGRYVLCLLPSVYKELTCCVGEMHECLKNLIENRMVKMKVSLHYENIYNEKKEKMIQNYSNVGYFLDGKEQPTVDAQIVAESSIFNLTLLSQDKHITKGSTEQETKKKIEKIKHINRKILNSDFNGHQAEPWQLEKFFTAISKGMPVSQPENITILDSSIQYKLNAITNNNFNSSNKKNTLNFALE